MAHIRHRPAGMSDEDTDSDDEFFFRPKKNYFSACNEKSKVENTLQVAIINGKTSDVQAIVCKDLNNMINSRLDSGWTILMHACFHAQKEIVKFLLDNGADPNLHAESVTPIMVACSNSTVDNDTCLNIILNLIDKDCLLNIGDKYGQTPLMRAISSGRVAVVQKLLDMHVNMESRDSQGWTPLFWAVHHNQPEILELLVSHGARMTEVDKSGRTPLDIANSHEYENIIEILNKHLHIEKTIAEIEHVDNQMASWFEFYPGITKQGLPNYYSEIPHLLYGMNCEQIEPLLRNKGLTLRSFLLLQDNDMLDIGIHMQFQRRRLQIGLRNFHKRTWKLHAVAGLFAAKNDNFSVLDCLTTLGSHLQQIYILEATLQYSLREYRAVHGCLKTKPPDSPPDNKTVTAVKSLICNIACARAQARDMRKTLLKISSKNPPPADLIKETSAGSFGAGYLTETVMLFSVGLILYHSLNYFSTTK